MDFLLLNSNYNCYLLLYIISLYKHITINNNMGIKMLVTTTNNIEGKKIVKYLGLVSGEAIMGANIFKDFFAGIRDIVGGRSAAYEKELRAAKDLAIKEMTEQASMLGGNAVIAVDLDYETVGQGASMLMVTASGTAIVLED
jgi:uncharacterized protein YbjQ (UPF0145 family)